MADAPRIPIVVETSRYRIRGTVTLGLHARLSDYANEGRDFFAITDALVAPIDNPDREREVGFILVARHEVGVILPTAEEEDARDHDPTRARTADHYWSFME